MKEIKKYPMIAIAYAGVIISVLSLLLPIFVFASGGNKTNYSLFTLLFHPEEMTEMIEEMYAGYTPWDIGGPVVQVFAVIAVLALICAVVGLAALSRQRKATWPFVLTLIGLIGTMLPALMIFASVLICRGNLPGSLVCGFYPIITPVAMVICMVVSSIQFYKNRVFTQMTEREDGLFTVGGDL